MKLDDATVIGITEGPSTSFLGIPFAQPPYVLLSTRSHYNSLGHLLGRSVGNLRLQLPQPIVRHTGIINATAFGNQCVQQKMDSPALPPDVPPELRAFVEPMGTPLDVPQSEDCEVLVSRVRRDVLTALSRVLGLNLNVIVPAGTRPGAKLPIAVVSTYPHFR